MKYEDAKVVEYAERRLRALRSGSKAVLAFMGTALIAVLVALIWMVHDKSEQLGERLMGNEVFLAGFALGIMFMFVAFLGAFGVAAVFRNSYGLEAAVYELAVRLGRKSQL